MSSLPDISIVRDVKPSEPYKRTAEEQAAIDRELDELHEALSSKRGEALKEAMRPELVVPTPQLQAAVAPAETILSPPVAPTGR